MSQEHLYGWTAQEAQGRITHSLLNTHFPVSHAHVEARLEQNGYWEGELVHLCRDGALVLVDSRQAVMRDGQGHLSAILEINRNITGRRQLEQQAQADHAQTVARLSFLQQIIDALPSSIYLVYGPDARLLLANRAAASVWGKEWPIDQPMQEFLTSNNISIVDVQGRPLAPQEYATLRAVRHSDTIRRHQETIRHPNRSTLAVALGEGRGDPCGRPGRG